MHSSSRSARIQDTLIVRALVGALVAGTVAAFARRAGALTGGGQWAAFIIGALVAAAGWPWAALLIAYFVTSSLLTRLGRARKIARTESVLPTHVERSALQVAANGGVFTCLVVLGEASGDRRFLIAALGALSASAADTWATELGTLWGSATRSILTGRVLPTGVSGGVTAVGFAGSALAAALMAATVGLVLPGVPDPELAVAGAILAAGIAGSVADSLLGATLQSKRWCEQCRTWTERRVHTCQYRTQHARVYVG